MPSASTRAKDWLRSHLGSQDPVVDLVPVHPGERAPEVSADQVPAVDPTDYRRLRNAHWRLLRQVMGKDRVPATAEELQVDTPLAQEAREEAQRARALAVFAAEIARGTSLEQAHVHTVRALCDIKMFPTARAISIGLDDSPSFRAARHLGLGLVTHRMRFNNLAWPHFADVDDALLAELVATEAVTSALGTGSTEAEGRALSIGSMIDKLSTQDLVELAGRFIVAGHTDLARKQMEEVDRRGTAGLDERLVAMAANNRRWTMPALAEPPRPDGITVAVMDYYQPDYDRASCNVGDYVQTLAMLGNLARWQDVTFTGTDGLGALMTGLQERVRPELELGGHAAEVDLVPVSRDFSMDDSPPANTWMIAFGWHMHPMFRIRFGLPYHPNLNPIFVSFHVNHTGLLDEPTIAYLQEHGPIGCRDWATVDLLLGAGVDAFFTGCLTTTVDGVFPPLEEVDREEPGVALVVDLPERAGRRMKIPVERASNGETRFRDLDLVAGIEAASDILAGYQTRVRTLLTSRLHAYLPATSLGIDARLRPPVPGDVRFDGLLEMKPDSDELIRMRDGIRDLVAGVFEQVLAGASRQEVYAHWRALTAPQVEDARRRWEAPAQEVEIAFDLAGTVARLRAGVIRFGPHDQIDPGNIVDVAVSLDADVAKLLPTTLESLVTNSSKPVRLWITTRGLQADHRADYFEWLAKGFPAVPMTFLAFDDVDHGVDSQPTMDRLLLPEVLSELDRLVYLDVDTITEGDIGELAALDLEEPRWLPAAHASPTRQTPGGTPATCCPRTGRGAAPGDESTGAVRRRTVGRRGPRP